MDKDAIQRAAEMEMKMRSMGIPNEAVDAIARAIAAAFEEYHKQLLNELKRK